MRKAVARATTISVKKVRYRIIYPLSFVEEKSLAAPNAATMNLNILNASRHQR